jgi:hypothetical protein
MTDKVKKKVTIVVNGQPFEVEKDEIKYEEVVALAYPDYSQFPNRIYSVKYQRGHGNKPEGILTPGGEVKVKDEMIFNVKITGES